MYVDRLEAAYDRLAYHYAKTDEADRAVEYLTRFAEQAAGRFAHVEAAAALREALAHVERLPAEIRERRLYELVLRQNVSLFFIGCFRENLDLLLRHQERVERLGDPTLTGPFFYHLATAYYMLETMHRRWPMPVEPSTTQVDLAMKRPWARRSSYWPTRHSGPGSLGTAWHTAGAP